MKEYDGISNVATLYFLFGERKKFISLNVSFYMAQGQGVHFYGRFDSTANAQNQNAKEMC